MKQIVHTIGFIKSIILTITFINRRDGHNLPPFIRTEAASQEYDELPVLIRADPDLLTIRTGYHLPVKVTCMAVVPRWNIALKATLNFRSDHSGVCR